MATDPTQTTVADQPPPTPNDGPSILALVRADLAEREQVGIARYGTPLQPHNGRDALVDLYQELLDAAAYTRQLIEEKRAPISQGMQSAAAAAIARAWAAEAPSLSPWLAEQVDGTCFVQQLAAAAVDAARPLIEAAILRQVADECDTIREGSAIGEWRPTAEAWMRHRADQIENGATDVG